MRVEIVRLRERATILRNAGYSLRIARGRYARIDAMKGLPCERLTVLRSGYYKWKSSGPSPRARDDAVLGAKVADARRRSRRTYGAPRVMRELRAQGVRISKRRCARLLKALGLQGRRRCRGTPALPTAGTGRLQRPIASRNGRRRPVATRCED